MGHGSKGGWDKFGPERVVTRKVRATSFLRAPRDRTESPRPSPLYKEYLGDKAKDLPASGLLFPLSLRASSKDDKALVRTLLAVDHDKRSLTFAGDIPKGFLAQGS
ncbi:MAG: FIST C-terminal domain-containing protein [Labilithrix sp.]|nr:FIST C-terminal domain-containing protein [Labilithrix sp.]